MNYLSKFLSVRITAFILSLCTLLLFTGIISLFTLIDGCNEVRDRVVRLHILANSDSVEDQRIKLAVRDAVLECSSTLFDASVNTENVFISVEKNRKLIEETANRVIKESGFDYTAGLEFTQEFFDTREYDGFTMPAGKYKAVKLILGEGQGKNWWCVMFPPLCLPAASACVDTDVFFAGNSQLIEGSGFQVRFRIVEVIEKIKRSFS